MRFSIPLAAFQMLLLGTEVGVGDAFSFRGMLSKFNPRNRLLKSKFHGSSDIDGGRATALYATGPSDDQYSSIVEAYQRRRPPAPGTYSLSTQSTPSTPPQIADPVPSLPVDPSPDTAQALSSTITSTPPPADVATATDSVTAASSSVTDIAQAIYDAAASAIEAAERASEAAASISAPAAVVKVTAVTSAAATATAASTAAGDSVPSDGVEKVPTLFDWFKGAPLPQSTKPPVQFIPATEAPRVREVQLNVPPDTKEKLIILKNNLLAGFSVGSGADAGAGASFESLNLKSAATIGAGIGASTSAVTDSIKSFEIEKLIENLQLQEYGAWYITAVTVVVALNQREEGRREAEKAFEVELRVAKAMADTAATAALQAAEGAKLAKQLAAQIPKAEANIGQILLETSKIEEVRLENQFMKEKITKLTVELNDQKELIAKFVSDSNGEIETKPKIEIPEVKMTMERDPKEDAKFVKIMKEMDLERADAKEKAEKEAKEKAALLAEKRKAAAAKRKATLARKKAEAAEAAKPAKSLTTPQAAVKKTRAPKKKTTVKKARTPKMTRAPKKKAVAEKTETDESLQKIVSAEEAFTEAISEISKEDAIIAEIKEIEAKTVWPKKKARRARGENAKNTITAAKEESVPSTSATTSSPNGAANPWGILKESTLKRKTIAQLSAYLEEREVDVSGLSKKDLVGTIQTL